MAILFLPFLVLAVIGLVLSLISHIAALLGLPQPLGPAAWALHIGIFVVWLPALLASRRLVPDAKRKDFWKEALRGCPRWIGLVTSAFFVYAVTNFLLFVAFAPPRGAGAGANAPPAVFRGFSGHWMAFYSAAATMLYSAIRRINVAEESQALADRWLGRPDEAQASDYDDQREADRVSSIDGSSGDVDSVAPKN